MWHISLKCFRGTELRHAYLTLRFLSELCGQLITSCSVYSTDAVSLDHRNWEDSISALFVTAETLVKHFEPKVQAF